MADRHKPLAPVLALALMPGLLPGPAPAQSMGFSAGLVAAEPGLYCALADTQRRDAPDTISGWVHVARAPVQRIASGQVAPAVLGLGFGVRYTLREDVAGGPIDFRVTHPPMPPSGITMQSWSSHLDPGDTDTVFFQFDEPGELVRGTWKINARLNGVELFSIEFTVVDPDLMPDLRDLCESPEILSLSPSRRAAAG